MSRLHGRVAEAFGVNEPERLSLSEMLGNSLGLALALLAAFTLVHGSAGLLPAEPQTWLKAALLLGAGVAGVIVSTLSSRYYSVFLSVRFATVASLAGACCAAALIGVAQLSQPLCAVLAGLCGAVLGVALCFTLLTWAALYVRMYIPSIVSCAFFASAACLVLFLILCARVPAPVGNIVSAALILVDVFFIRRQLRAMPPMGMPEEYLSFHKRKNDWGVFLYKVALPLLCLGVVMRLYLNHLEAGANATPDVLTDILVVIMLVVVFMVLRFAVFGVQSYRQPFAHFFAYLIPLVALIGLPAYAPGTLDGPQISGGTLASIALLMALAWSFMGGASLEYRLRSSSVFGLSLGCLFLGILGGEALTLLEPGSAVAGLSVAVICLLMAVGFLPPRPAPDLSRSRSALVLVQSTGIDDESGITPADQLPAELEDDRGDAGEGAGKTGGKTPSGYVSPFDAPASEDRPARGRFLRRCDSVAQRFLLSPREAEVLVLLAKGRSMAHIMDELVISEGTAKTHINHVYKKLGVHSRHELIDLIETTQVAP